MYLAVLYVQEAREGFGQLSDNVRAMPQPLVFLRHGALFSNDVAELNAQSAMWKLHQHLDYYLIKLSVEAVNDRSQLVLFKRHVIS